MKNRILLLIVIILIPIAIISFPKKTNFSMSKDEEIQGKKDIYVNFNDNKLLLDDYVYGVVGAEMPITFSKEALKAQILATRTFTLNKLEKNPDYKFSTNDQAYYNDTELQSRWQDKYQEYSDYIKELIKETEKEIITYNNTPIEAFYFAMSNGYTSSAKEVFGINEDYLISVSSDLENESLAKFKQEKEINYNEFVQNLGLSTPITINNIERDESNRVKSIIINNKKFTGVEIRKKLNLRSTDFNIYLLDDKIKIETKGYGHGVGLSQYGANELAKHGYNYKEIIMYYYHNVEITKMNV